MAGARHVNNAHHRSGVINIRVRFTHHHCFSMRLSIFFCGRTTSRPSPRSGAQSAFAIRVSRCCWSILGFFYDTFLLNKTSLCLCVICIVGSVEIQSPLSPYLGKLFDHLFASHFPLLAIILCLFQVFVTRHTKDATVL